jgi:uncharacterized protein YbjT (DUF2867 family)
MGRHADSLSWAAARGAQIAEGDQADERFFLDALEGADGLYLLIPPKMDAGNCVEYYRMMGESAGNAIADSDVRKVVFLSSLGGELPEQTGPIAGLHYVEEVLQGMPGIDLTIIRAGFFMENFLASIPVIRDRGAYPGAIEPDAPISMIATSDIAALCADLLGKGEFEGEQIIDYFGDRLTSAKVTRIMGEGIGNPDLPYVFLSADDAVAAYESMGASHDMARAYVEMSQAIGAGVVRPTRVDPETPNAPTSFAEFAQRIWFPAYRQVAR